MKFVDLILILLILIFTSCEEIKKDDIKGNWIIALGNGNIEPVFYELNFRENEVELISSDFFKETGKYQVERGRINIKLARNNLKLETKIKKLDVNTLVIFDSLKFERNLGYENYQLDEYQLIGINTEEYLSEIKNVYFTLHYYRKNNEGPLLRMGNKVVKCEEIYKLISSQFKNLELVLYLGKGITLKDLKNLYYNLASINQPNIILVTKQEGFSKTHIFNDSIEIWREDYVNYFANLEKIRPPISSPIEYESKVEFFQTGSKEIKLVNSKDYSKLDEINPQEKCVITINSNFSIAEYIEIKKKIREKRKINKQIIIQIE